MIDVRALNSRISKMIRNRNPEESHVVLAANILAALKGSGVTDVEVEPNFTAFHLQLRSETYH